MLTSINPVTFTGVKFRGSKEPVKLTIGRLHINTNQRTEVPDGMNRLQGPEVLEKLITCVVWTGDGKENFNRLAELMIDEDHFIKGLQHLFSKGEIENGQ